MLNIHQYVPPSSLLKYLCNSSLHKDTPDLLQSLSFRKQQTKQDTCLLRIEHSTSDLRLLIFSRDVSRGDLAVDSSMAQDDGDVILGDNVIDSFAEFCRDTSCALSGNLSFISPTNSVSETVGWNTYHDALCTILDGTAE